METPNSDQDTSNVEGAGGRTYPFVDPVDTPYTEYDADTFVQVATSDPRFAEAVALFDACYERLEGPAGVDAVFGRLELLDHGARTPARYPAHLDPIGLDGAGLAGDRTAAVLRRLDELLTDLAATSRELPETLSYLRARTHVRQAQVRTLHALPDSQAGDPA